MKSILPVKITNPSRWTSIIFAGLIAFLAVLAGASGLLFPSSYSPLLFLGVMAVIGILIVWLARPPLGLYAALIVVFLPVGLLPATIHSFLNRSITLIAIGVWLVWALWMHKKIVLANSAWFMIGFLVWSSVTVLWAEESTLASTALQTYLLRFLLFLFLIPNLVKRTQDLGDLMVTLAISGWVYIFAFVLTLLKEGYTVNSRLSLFGSNENGAGIQVMIGMIGVIWLASRPSVRHRTLANLIVALYVLLMFALVVMSASRGSAMSLAVTLALFYIWKPLRQWGVLGFMGTILALVFAPALFETLFRRFGMLTNATPLDGREVLWQAALQLIRHHPVGGVGIGNAPTAVVSYLEAGIDINGQNSASIHNPVLTIWSETGTIGILLYVGILASAIYSFARQYLRYRKTGDSFLNTYFALVSTIGVGYMLSWFKGGGMQSHFNYFLMLALLILPETLHTTGSKSVPIHEPAANKTHL